MSHLRHFDEAFLKDFLRGDSIFPNNKTWSENPSFPYKQLYEQQSLSFLLRAKLSTGQPSVFWSHKSVCRYRGDTLGLNVHS